MYIYNIDDYFYYICRRRRERSKAIPKISILDVFYSFFNPLDMASGRHFARPVFEFSRPIFCLIRSEKMPYPEG